MSSEPIPRKNSELRLRTGCYSFPNCTLPQSDVSGSWYLVTNPGIWGTWNLTLSQSGSLITGAYQNSFGQSGNIMNGVRNGNDLSFTIQPYCTVEVKARVQSGCTLTGSMREVSCPNTNPYTEFMGMRSP
jgi:hypothetical protein